MDNFRVVKRTSLPSQSRFNGSSPGAPRVRLHKTGNLNFSKLACEVFAVPHSEGASRPPRVLAIVEYDEDARTLKITGVDKPPKPLGEDDCFRLIWHQYKGSHFNCVMAAKRLLRYLGLEFQEPIDFPVASMNPETHSIVLTVPVSNHSAGDREDDQAAAGDSAAPNHRRRQAANRV